VGDCMSECTCVAGRKEKGCVAVAGRCSEGCSCCECKKAHATRLSMAGVTAPLTHSLAYSLRYSQW
jgi:hypothetical protein